WRRPAMKPPRHVTGTVLIALGSLTFPSFASENEVIFEWNQRLLQTIRETNGIPYGFPGPVSRNIAIVYASIYDAVNSITPTHERYYQIAPCPPGTSEEAAAATAA